VACYWGLRVCVTVNGQVGGGCCAANLRYLATPMARACFTVHMPIILSFKTRMLSLKCRSATRSYLGAGARRLFAPTLITFVGVILCELLAIVMNFTFRSTMFSLTL
jgi:hypothetical protein